MSEASNRYDEVTASTLRAFCGGDDYVSCVSYARNENGGTCQMCGHDIMHEYTLQNGATMANLVVGSSCVTNYASIIKNLFGVDRQVICTDKGIIERLARSGCKDVQDASGYCDDYEDDSEDGSDDEESDPHEGTPRGLSGDVTDDDEPDSDM